jgi:hypothetical protein
MTIAKLKLRSLDDLDARTNAARRARQLVADLENDLGGHDALSAGLRELVQRTALLGALCEDLEVKWLEGAPIDVGNYALLTNAQRRLLTTIGIERLPRDVSPTLDQYLHAKRQGADRIGEAAE